MAVSTAAALHLVAESVHKRSLVIIFSDMMETNQLQAEELFGALQHLKHNKHEVILFHVSDRQTEEEFLYDNRPYEFIDVETGERIKTHSAEIRDLYLKSYKKKKKLRVYTTRPDTIFGVDFMVVAPEHELIAELTTSAEKQAVDAYIANVKSRSERERTSGVATVATLSAIDLCLGVNSGCCEDYEQMACPSRSSVPSCSA
jgi:hypothetical protein